MPNRSFPNRWSFRQCATSWVARKFSDCLPGKVWLWCSQESIFIQLRTSLIVTSQEYSPRDISCRSPRFRTFLVLALFFDLFFELIGKILPGAIFLHICSLSLRSNLGKALFSFGPRSAKHEFHWNWSGPLHENLGPHGRMELANQSQLTPSSLLPELHADV